MRLSVMDRKTLTKVFSEDYAHGSKKIKSQILDEFINHTGYNRHHAATILKNYPGKSIKPRKRKKIYDKPVKDQLVKIWKILDFICGQRLASVLPIIIPVLEKHEELKLDPVVRKKLLKISSTTVDRMLSSYKRQLGRSKGGSHTSPGSFLKSQIPIRTYGDWPEKEPGYFEVDLVSHEGGYNIGDYFWTLNATDVNICWTISLLLFSKKQKDVENGMISIEDQLPFPIKGLDSDSGVEFINEMMLNYCKKRDIKFTRCRPYKKNDNCYVEQKNYSVVRRNIGYLRYDTIEEYKIISDLYKNLNLYHNYFIPSKKLLEKVKIGTKCVRKYDIPKTSYRRALENEYLSQKNKRKLKKIYKNLNPAELKRNINRLQDKLIKITKGKHESIIGRYQQKEDLYKLARYRKRNKPSKNNPSIFVEKLNNRRIEEDKKDKMKRLRDCIAIIDRSRMEKTK